MAVCAGSADRPDIRVQGRSSAILKAFAALLLGIALVSGAAPAHAVLPGSEIPTDSLDPPAAPKAGSISVDGDAEQDDRIAARLSDIFANVPSLTGVEADVAGGVVTLSGTAPDDEAVARAAAIAGGVQGVVTVENGVERDVSVDVEQGIGGISDRVAELWRMLPLAGLALLVALGIALFGYLIASFRPLWNRVAPNSFLADLIVSAIRFVFVILGLVVALDMIGAGALMGAVLGGAGVIGIALGFAMRDMVENYVASLMMSLRQPFRANDHIMIDGAQEGRVIRLTSRATVLMTLDGNHLRIPNSTVFKATILNFTRNPQRRFDFELGVDADDDAQAARQLGRETLRGLDFVLDDPAAEVRITQVGDSNVVLRFLGWIDQREADWHKAKSNAIAACKVALEDAGFALPEPIYRLRFDQRTSALPFENIGARTEGEAERVEKPAPARKTKPKPSPATVATHGEDVRPDNEIARMVEDERRETGGEQANDLLDHARPVE